MAQVSETEILDALKRVVDPESGKDVVSLGIVSGLVVKDGNVGFSLEVPAEKGAAMEPLRKAAEAAVDAVAGVLSVTAVLTAHRPGGAPPQQAQRPEQDAGPIPGQPLAPGVRTHRRGGQRQGRRRKIDHRGEPGPRAGNAGLHSRAARRRHLRPVAAPHDGHCRQTGQPRRQILQPMENFGIKVMSMGFLVDEETPMIWRGPMVIARYSRCCVT